MRTLSPDVVCVRSGGWAEGRETGKMRIAEMDRCLEPGVLRLRDITESRSAESGRAGGGPGPGEGGLVTEGRERAPTFVHVRLKFSVGFQ